MKYNMDKKAIGEQFVTNVINAYILSEDFDKDAMHHVYKRIYDEYNSRMAQLGVDVSKNLNSIGDFQKQMEVYTTELEYFKKIFGTVFDYAPEYQNAINVIFNAAKPK